MTEGLPIQFENKADEREQKIKEAIALAAELRESQEVFPFPGIDAEAYQKMKDDEEKFPGHVTPIDELAERFGREGMKIVLGAYPESQDIFLLPAQSDDIISDSILSRHLQIDETMNEKLKKLILVSRDIRIARI